MLKEVEIAVDFLKNSDQTLSSLIERIGDCTITKNTDYFNALVRSVISQQLSNKAANSIYQRLLILVEGEISPDNILKIEPDELRNIGISKQKSKTIQNLADTFIKHPGFFDNIEKDSNEEVIVKLSKLHGIGEWTTQMFLIFCLSRLDLLPLRDTGFRRSIKLNYGFSNKLTDKDIVELSKKWHPYSSVAAWYLWQALDS